MGESKKYVVYGMMAKCSEGTIENYISTDKGHGVVYQGQPVLNANDHQKGVNLTHFGDCNSKKIYEEAKKEIDEKYKAEEGDGFFTKLGKGLVKAHMKTAIFVQEHLMFHKCELDTPLPWIFTSKDHMIDGAPALTMESQCACRYGGIITIVPGEAENVGMTEKPDEAFEQVKEELIQTIKNEPWNIPKLHDLFIKAWGTETGNKIESDLFNLVAFAVSPTFAFEYVPKPEDAPEKFSPYWDYYRTNETYGIQRRFGFMDLYDHCGWLLGMRLDTEILTFIPEGSDKEYRLQFWKGSYAGGGAFGGEIGLYVRNVKETEKMPYTDDNLLKNFVYYDCVSGEDEIETIQHIYTKSGKLLLYNNTEDYADEDDHFWNLAIKTIPGYQAEDLVVVETLIIDDENMREAMVEAVQNNDTLKLVDDQTVGNKIVIQYGEFEDEN